MIKTLLAAVALAFMCASPSSAQGIFDMPGGFEMETLGMIANGDMSGASQWTVLGTNLDLDIGTEDLWDYGGDIQLGASAETLYVSADGAAAQVLLIEGLDGSGDEVSATATLNGVAFVEVTGQTFWRVHRVTVQGATALTNNAYIHIDDVDTGADGIPDTLPGDVRSYIPSGQARSRNGFFTCPNDRTCYAIRPNVSGGQMLVSNHGGLFCRTASTEQFYAFTYQGTPGTQPPLDLVRFTELQDIKFQATSGSDNAIYVGSAVILMFAE